MTFDNHFCFKYVYSKPILTLSHCQLEFYGTNHLEKPIVRNLSRKRIHAVISCIIGCVLIGTTSISGAAEQSGVEADGQAEIQEKTPAKTAWTPPEPAPADFDWIQLSSGEWLKGTLKTLYDSKLTFDSDKLGLLELDWEDVRQFLGHRPFSARFEGAIVVDGQLRINETSVFITMGEETQQFDRHDLLAIAQEESKEIDYWSGKLNLGLSFASGNTDQTQYSAIASLNRQTSSTRFVNTYLANYTKTDGENTINNHRFNTYFDLLRTRRYFLRPVFGEYYRDPIKNIAHRATVGTGLGYHIIDTPKTKWDVSGGPAYQYTQFNSVEAGQDDSESTPVLMAGTEFNRALNDTVEFDFLYNFQLVNERSGSYNHHLVATLETELTKFLNFDVSFVWDRTETPQPKEDGTVPDPNDYYLIFSIGADF